MVQVVDHSSENAREMHLKAYWRQGKRMNGFLVSSLGKVVLRSGVYSQVNEHRKNNINNEWTKKTFMRLPCY
jgi:hypothetical protein